ncbi:MAG: hypothetical protein QHC89_17405 [Bosea sp. (in: a-proteobacteria)]|nr:hypothetical protein [Bosea sp. (in: a-proteobacteria)]
MDHRYRARQDARRSIETASDHGTSRERHERPAIGLHCGGTMMPAILSPFSFQPGWRRPFGTTALPLAFDHGTHYTKELPMGHRYLQRLIT